MIDMVKTKKTEMKNGIRVVSETHPGSRAVSLGIWLLNGSRDESPEMQGASHFLEHLVFKGTKKRTAYQIAKSLECLGGDLNAYTTKEYTVFHALVLQEHWEIALDVLCDLVQNMQVASKDFRNEKQVILQEIAMTDDNNEDQVFEKYFDLIYPKHSLGRPIAGTEGSVRQISQKQINQFYEHFYAGNRLIVSCAGNVDHSDLISGVQKRLSRKKKNRKSFDRKQPRFNVDRRLIERPGEQQHLILGFEGPSYKSRTKYHAYILNALIGGGMTSKLFQSIREKKGLAYSVYSMLTHFSDTGLFSIYAGADVDQMQKVVRLIHTELAKVRRNGLTQRELDMYRTQVVGSMLLGADDLENRMSSIALNELIYGRFRSVEEVVSELQNVDLKSMNQYVDEVLDPSLFSGLILGKEASKQSWFLKK